ncbi:odorant receptor 72 [Nasonia vitripennis]|uniref:Odorant receptor n=1 Tax=Nasonia vitripennis TaxID=7425 RepID=A0A7M6UWR4_NASVI|nr:odorant receptor 72 [Nasonia vitripennis]
MDDEIFIRPYQISLKLVGAWPGCAKLSGFFFVTGWSSILLFFALWNTTEVYENLDFLVDNLVNVIAVVVGLLKLTTLRVKRRTLMTILNKMLEDWQTMKMIEEFKAMTDNFERSKWICKSIVMLYNSLILTFLLKPAISYMNDSVEHREYLAPVSFPKFMDAKQSPMYEIITAGEIVTTFLCLNSHALIEGLLASSVLHACSKVDAVRQEIVKFSDVCRTQSGDKMLKLTAIRRLVNVHVNCDEFSENVENIFTVISFFHISLLTLMQVLSGYMFILNLEEGGEILQTLHHGLIIIVILVSCGYYCIAGEYLTNQNELLNVEIYNCFWTEFPVPQQKAIKFILAKSQRPVRLTFGKFDQLNLLCLTKIIKTSFSYLSLVRQVH